MPVKFKLALMFVPEDVLYIEQLQIVSFQRGVLIIE